MDDYVTELHVLMKAFIFIIYSWNYLHPKKSLHSPDAKHIIWSMYY